MSEETDDLLAAWKGHPVTQNILKGQGKAREAAVQHLKQVSKESADPKVRAAFARLEALDGVVVMLGGKKHA